MSTLAQKYIRKAVEILQEMAASQAEQIDMASEWVAESIGDGHRIYIARTSHSLDTEAYNRAGGLVAVHPVGEIMEHEDPLDSIVLGKELREGMWSPEPGDVAIVATNAGIDYGTVGVARQLAEHGCKIIALTMVDFEKSPLSIQYNRADKSLHEIADLVVDLGGEVGDGIVDVKGLDYKISPTSGVAGMVAMWAIFSGAYEKLYASGKQLLVYPSSELEGGLRTFYEMKAEYDLTRLGYREL
jgi:uncharacterized phosphosugar-binding protein